MPNIPRKIYSPQYTWKIHPRKYIPTKETSFTVVLITSTECFVTYTTGSQYLSCIFCIFWLTYVHLVFRDIFPSMFGSPGWINIKIGSFGSLLSFYLNKLFFESALKLQLWKLCENRNFAGMQKLIAKWI